MDRILGQKGEAKLEEIVTAERSQQIMTRGKLTETDKHWGMRSNLKFRKILVQGKT